MSNHRGLDDYYIQFERTRDRAGRKAVAILLTGGALLTAIIATVLLCARALAQDGYEPGVIAVRSDAGRWELLRVAPGTEEAHLVALASAGRETTRLAIAYPFDSPIFLPAIVRDWDGQPPPRLLPSDPEYSRQWAIHTEYVNVPLQPAEPPGAIIADLDTGLQSMIDPPAHIVGTYNAMTGGDNVSTSLPHGTHVVSILAAPHNDIATAGVCPQCGILAVKVCRDEEAGACYETDIVAGLEWSVQNGAQIALLEMGTQSPMPYLAQAIGDALDAGVVVVVPRGNAGNTLPQYPACVENVLAISALHPNYELVSGGSWSSSWGGDTMAFAAPGVNVLTEKGYFNGTSAAAPHVAGAFGVVLSEHPGWTGQDAYDWLVVHALDLGESGWDDRYGWGMVLLP